jgi:hypothetical protein
MGEARRIAAGKQAVARLVDMQMCGAHALDRLAHVSSTASASNGQF